MNKELTYLISFSELPLKEGRRKRYIKLLENAIKKAFAGNFLSIDKMDTSLVLNVNIESREEADCRLSKIFGISNFICCEKIKPEIEGIKNKSLELLTACNYKSFCARTKRFDKSFHLDSMQIDKEVGAFIVEKTGSQVDLKSPNAVINIFLFKKIALVGLNKIIGAKGVPVGDGQRALMLLSGGHSSTLSSYLTIKRGFNPVFMHFHSEPFKSSGSLDYVKRLAEQICQNQVGFSFYSVAIGNVQKDIANNYDAELRQLIYKKLMFKVAEKISKDIDCRTIITGERLGDADDTGVSKLLMCSSKIDVLLIRPVAIFSKEEVVNQLRNLGLLDFMTKEYDDCISFMKADISFKDGFLNVFEKVDMISEKYLSEVLGSVKKEVF